MEQKGRKPYKKYKRIFTIVVDSLGVGGAPDAEAYKDLGADTLGNIVKAIPDLKIPNMRKLGIGNLHPLEGMDPVENPKGYYGYLQEMSKGKDTLTGHWEMMGVYTKEPFQVFTDTGFPPELIQELETRTGREIVGNKSASGTEIIEEYYKEEIDQGKLIVYTSADSVLQICGNEETMGIKTLYQYCEIARELTMKEEWKVARIIARPYTGMEPGAFVRTANRHDYALSPPHKTYLDGLKEAGYEVISIGKIYDIFNGKGLTESNKSQTSLHGMEQTIDQLDRDFTGLCFTNLVDFDALWGHRRNVEGYGRELEKFDQKLGVFMEGMKEDDLLMITADHGNDPTFSGTDHTREQVFILAYSQSMKEGGVIETQNNLGVIGATIGDNFQVTPPELCIGTPLTGLY